MKKIITIYFFVFNILFVFSQDQASVTLNWTEKKELAYGKTSYNIPQFDILNLQFDSYARTLKYSSRVKLNGLANENGLELSTGIFCKCSRVRISHFGINNDTSRSLYWFSSNAVTNL